MKKILLCMLFGFGLASAALAQCSTNSAPTNNCTFSDLISAFSLNNIPSVGNSGCSAGGYSFFPTPVRTLMLGNTYTWSATLGGLYPDALAIWIDLNNDGFYTGSEQMAVSPAALTHTGSITIPFTATPASNIRMRVRTAWNAATISNTAACTNGIGSGYGETEDYLVDIITPPPCQGLPPATTVLATSPVTVCPGGSIGLYSSTSYTLWGYAFQWEVSTQSSIGNYTAVPGATTTAYTATNITTASWYREMITCGNQTTYATPIQVMVQGTTTNSVPYFEGFEGIYANNILPNCSWMATNTPSITQTYTQSSSYNRVPHSGNKFASFRYGTNPNGDYFYSNGIQLDAGVTYSAGVWRIVDGLAGWSNFSLLYGTTQTTTGLTPIASVTGTLGGQFYQLMSNTFSVPSSGIYYLAIKAIGSASTWYLTFDDLFVMIPCTPASGNSPTVTLSATTTTLCAGSQVSLTAGGANTYSWSTGANTSSILQSPLTSTNYFVTGTNTLTSCSETKTQAVTVYISPQVSVYAGTPTVCAGEQVALMAFGANTYTWDTGTTGPLISITPTSTSVYSVTGANSLGCTGTGSLQITVNPLPTLTVTSTKTLICKEDEISLNVNGALTYQWISSSSPLVYQGASVNVSPSITTIYTITGTNGNGCVNETAFTLSVTVCSGIKGLTGIPGGVKVYPNPSFGELTVEVNNNSAKTIEVTDLTGRQILSVENSGEKTGLNISKLANGFYYVKVRSAGSVEVIKIVKQ